MEMKMTDLDERDAKYMHSAQRRRLGLVAMPRPATGFLATLTPEQREIALSYRGADTFGDPSMKRRRSDADRY